MKKFLAFLKPITDQDILQSRLKFMKDLCFVCNISPKDDAKIYNEGGLGLCSEKLLECLEAYKEGHPQFEAAKRLQLIVCGHAH